MDDLVKLTHGAGGTVMESLLKQLFIGGFSMRHALDGVGIDALDDGASIVVDGREVVVTMDGHTVDPIFFPGGDLGRLAISGAVNDTSVMGARPVAILDSIIVEEGYKVADLKRLVNSMDETAWEAGVAVIGGDFKVMPRGHIDNVVISTCGIGVLEGGRVLDSGSKPGDKVLVTGTVGDHGIALMSAREGLAFETELESDVAPIWSTIRVALETGEVDAMKDPTRGGLSAALNDIAAKSGVSIWLEENRIPIKNSVRAASEMLGLDPYEVTCEGKAVMCVGTKYAEDVLDAIKGTKYGKEAKIIGEVRSDRPGFVLLKTMVGGTRILRKPLGESIPRVC
ncbi:MAG: hydrogenase expression/formation protein HypE [Candidatus Bathyarchaeota archaeon]|nr:MAG: hydrogenase expression/formation protein HypE [Candidatus Bathyarchaeota archaeon]